MKLMKKALALTLICLMLAVPAAFAQTQEYYTDDFNQFTKDETLSWSGYPVAPGSDVFVKFNGSGGKISASGGRDGKAALQLTTRLDGNNAALQTKNLDTGAGDEIMFTIDFCLADLGSNPELIVDTKRIGIGSRADYSGELLKIGYHANGSEGAGMYFEQNGEEKAACKVGEWYSLSVLQTATQRMGVICGDDGEIVAESVIKYNMKAQESAVAVRIPAFKPADGVAEGMSMLFDNAALYRYNTAADAPSCVGGTVEDGAEGVRRNQSLSFTFDQKVSGEIALLANGAEVPGIQASQSGFNRVTVSYDGLLEKDTVYTLSFGGVQNTGGIACDGADVSFTTEKLHPWEDVVITGVRAGKGGKTQVSFQLADPYGYEEFSGAVIAAVYQEGRMMAADMVSLDRISTAGVITEEFQLGGFSGTGAALTLILLDADDGPVPLASGTWMK